ncbi:MAG TPA: hypothetical protein EYG72_00200 [Candidatus Pacebacteria bacterium]|nr:hypothetical protein [Candidatus Paceibacterota bacterium]
MEKQFVILRMDKGKGAGGGLSNHIDRVPGMEHTYKRADPKRKHLNFEFKKKYANIPLHEAVKKRIKNGYKTERKIRNTAVKYVATILSGSHERMIEISKNKKLFKQWIIENGAFMKEEVGAENIIRFTLHMDEKTPHIHCVFVPLTKDGRLSAKEVMGNRTKFFERQKRYALRMEQFGLQRGVSSKRKHTTTEEYYKSLEQAIEEIQKMPFKSVRKLKPRDTATLLEKIAQGEKIAIKLQELLNAKQQRFKM